MNNTDWNNEQQGLLQVITDFLAMGHMENIVAMFKQDASCYALTGLLLQDERYVVRIGIAVLFEELKRIRPNEITQAIPSLVPLLTDNSPTLRGEAAHLLGVIGTSDALARLAALHNDPDSQVREIVADILAGSSQQL